MGMFENMFGGAPKKPEEETPVENAVEASVDNEE